MRRRGRLWSCVSYIWLLGFCSKVREGTVAWYGVVFGIADVHIASPLMAQIP
jgi:hypothetical protein